MLRSLRIENFALIDSLELQLADGLTVLTGETGAGKSIILDAIDAVLGGKVSSRMVRTGTERSLIEATFEIPPDLLDWLQQQQIPPSGDRLLTCNREITLTQGSQRSRSRLNGMAVNKQQMEQVRDRLVEITAQGQTVQLGSPPQQRQWLDSYGGESLMQQRDRVATAFSAYQQATQALEKRRKSEQQRLQQLDLFEYQLKELTAAHLTDAAELERLEQERKRLTHSVDLQQQSYQVYQILYENESGGTACADLLGRAEGILHQMVDVDAELQPLLELVSTALSQVEEAGRQVNLYGENLEADPQRLEDVQQRIGELKQICRKYGPTLAEAIALQERLQTDLQELTGGGLSLEELEETLRQRRSVLMQDCATLTELRRTAAIALQTQLIAELKPLAMEKVQFEVAIAPCPPTTSGADQVQFRFSPNPGEPLQPLTEIASGGEMSRFLLALQASFSQVDPVGTLVFDEIDVGVSGRVTQAIAQKLFQLSRHHQVLCVTHQPIVAAMADHHFRVSKHVIDTEPGTAVNGKKVKGKGQKEKAQPEKPTIAPGESSPLADQRTIVRIAGLSQEERQEELAQLAGGHTDQEAIAFASALLSQAAQLRQTQKTVAPTSSTETMKPIKDNRSRATKQAG